MTKTLRTALCLLTLTAAASVAGSASADAPPAAASDPEVARLLKEGHSLKWNAVPAGASERHGHGEVLIGASSDRVRQVVTNFSGYKDLMPDKFNNARIMAKEGSSTDVYMQIPMKGALLRSLSVWQVLRFGPTREIAPGVQQLEGTFVRGNNVKNGHLLFTWKAVNANTTLLKVDILITPGLPATQSMIDEELRDAARQAVDAVHDRAQGNTQTVTQI